MIDRIVQKLAVMANDQGGMRIFFEPRLQPHGPFQIEIIGRLIKEEQVRFGKQGRCQGHPHPPAARKLGHGAAKVGGGKAEAGENFSGAGRRAIGIDLDQAAIDLAQTLGRRGFQFLQKAVALDIGFKNCVDQGDWRRGMFLADRADAGIARHGDIAAARMQLIQDQLEKGGLTNPITPHQANLGPCGQADRRIVEKTAAPGGIGQVFDLQHRKITSLWFGQWGDWLYPAIR